MSWSSFVRVLYVRTGYSMLLVYFLVSTLYQEQCRGRRLVSVSAWSMLVASLVSWLTRFRISRARGHFVAYKRSTHPLNWH